MKTDLTQQYLKSILYYDPITGLWIWLCDRGYKVKAGTKAGRLLQTGYISIGIDNKQYLAHRLAWLYMTGEWPKDLIDHKDRIKHNNKWLNLREATNAQNMRNTDFRKNNTSGMRGVRYHQGKFVANARIDGKNIYIGIYDTLKEASDAFENANIKYNYPNHKIASDYIQGVMLG